MTYRKTRFLPAVLGTLILLATPLAAQHVDPAGVDLRGDRPRFSFFAGIGYGALDGFDESAFVFELEPGYELKRSHRSLVELTVPLLWLPASRPLPGGDDAVFPGPVSSGELEIDGSLAIIPSIEWTRRTLRCCRFSLFAGAGVVFEKGRESTLTVGGSGDLIELRAETPDAETPVLTFGIALSHHRSDRLDCRLKLRFYTAFYDDRTLTSDRLGDIVVEGSHQSGVLLTAGLRFK